MILWIVEDVFDPCRSYFGSKKKYVIQDFTCSSHLGGYTHSLSRGWIKKARKINVPLAVACKCLGYNPENMA